MSGSLENKVALVTGASRGIGRAIALALGQQGATVIGTATSEAGALSITGAFQDAGMQGEGMQLDICDAASIDATMAQIKERYGDPLLLINNAAICKDNLFLRMREEEWSSVIDTNLNALFRMTKACLKPMLKARWGRIVTISSVVGLTGNPGQANYAATKAGLIGFSKSIAQEIGSRGITVNVVAPGFIDTDMTKNLPDAQREQLQSQIALRRLGQPEDIAAAVAFLTSPSADYITGETLHVNGGMYMA